MSEKKLCTQGSTGQGIWNKKNKVGGNIKYQE